MKFTKMGSSSVNKGKIKVKTQANALGKTEVEWEIVGWGGPMGHQLRSRATCHVTVPLPTTQTINTTNSVLRLRFHLKPYQNHEEPDQKFCNQRVKYVPRSIDCSCYTCKTVPLSATTAELPAEFMPKCPTRSAGYSLMVDVLNAPQNDVTLGVSGKMFNGNDCALAFQNLVTVDPASSQKDIFVVANFCPMVKWTEDKSGNISNCVKTTSITDENAHFALTVTAYRNEEIGMDKNPSPTATAVTPKVMFKPTIINTFPDGSKLKCTVIGGPNVIWNGTLEFLCKDVGKDSSAGQWKMMASCQAMALLTENKNAEMTGNGWPSKLNIEVRRTESVIVSDGKCLLENGGKGHIVFALDGDNEDSRDSVRKMLQEHVGIVLFNENADAKREHASTDKGLLFVHDKESDNFFGLVLKDEPVTRAIIRNVLQSSKNVSKKKKKRNRSVKK